MCALYSLGIASMACTASHDESEPVSTASAPIFNGVVDNTGTLPHVAAVARIFVNKSVGVRACSATAISRTHLLTAAHCVCDQAAASAVTPGAFAPPTPPIVFAQAPAFQPAVTNVVLHPIALTHCQNPLAGTPRDHDLAILTLGMTVPSSVVATLPRIAFGNLEQQDGNGTLAPAGTLVGYGLSSGYECEGFDDGATPDGNRRVGLHGYVYPHWDDCSGFPADFECFADMVWQASDKIGSFAIFGPGDSGGPLYKTHSDFGLVLAGVASGHVNLFGYPDKCKYFRWTPTGHTGGSPSNQNFILGELGGDPDGDLVPEAVDNCAATRCPNNPTGCANPLQEDADGDGVGDICDNCNPSDCTGFPSYYSCSNPTQHDADEDGLGDSCDPCPELAAFTNDSDGDGVGDLCDGCPDTYSPYGPCGPTCLGICVEAVHGTINVPHCSQQPDDDLDGIPDECDTCSFADDGINSNDLAELRENAEPKADQCDPVPLLRLQAQTANKIPFADWLKLTPGDGVGPDDLQRLLANRWLGIDETSPGVSFDDNRNLIYRHCDCFTSMGVALDFDACLQTNCLVTTHQNPGIFRVMEIHREVNKKGGGVSAGIKVQGGDPSGPASIPPPEITDQLLTRFTTDTTYTTNLIWTWRDDLVNGRVDGVGDCSLGKEACETHGIVLAGVTGPGIGSARDAAGNLRHVFRMYDTPNYYTEPLEPQILYPENDCTGAPCLRWLDSRVMAVNPDPTHFMHRFDGPVILTTNASSVYALEHPDAMTDITADVPENVRLLIADPDRLWLSPVESRVLIRRYVREPAQAVVIPTEWSDAPTFAAVQLTAHGLAVSQRAAEPPIALSVTSGSLAPKNLRRVTALYSALEHSVIVVGNVNDDDEPSQIIWRHDLTRGTWRVAIPAPALGTGRVLSLGYDPVRGDLFVVGSVKEYELTSQPEQIRLIHFNPRSGTSTLLQSWSPEPGAQYHVTALGRGGLVLTVGTTNKLEACLLAFDGQTLSSGGHVTHQGVLLGQPLMGDSLPVAGLKTAGGFERRELGPFTGKGTCSFLAPPPHAKNKKLPGAP